MIISRTPFRVSFFGGGTDYPAWYLANGGAVFSTTIDKYCYITCRQLPPFFDHKFRIAYSKIEHAREISDIQHPSVRAVLSEFSISNGLEIHHDSDLPARSGLGSSSAFTVGLINSLKALGGHATSKQELAKLAIHIEQNVIKETVGSQDQIAVAHGGLNRIEFERDNTFRISPVILPGERRNMFEKNLMLFFTGFSRFATDIAQAKVSNFGRKERELRLIRDLVDESIRILQSDSESLDRFGSLLHESWMHKKSLADVISSVEIDSIYETARKNGALGGKLLGAGGGGFMLLFVPPQRHGAVREALRNLIYVPFSFETQGSQIILYDPQKA